MIFELRGVEFVNKGGELMLHAIMHELIKQYPNAKFAMEVRGKIVPKHKLDEYGILEIFRFRKKNIDLTCLGNYIPSFFLKKIRMVSESQIEIILDGSGFAYGEKWGFKKLHNYLGRYLDRWKKSGKIVVLLPQAFGPFDCLELKSEMARVIQKVDLIFARDQKSFRSLVDLYNANQIIHSPDFTNLIGTSDNINLKLPNPKRVSIIPNFKMVQNYGEEVYFNFLLKSIEFFQLKNIICVFLNHEGEKDNFIIKKLNDQLTSKIEVFSPDDPLEIKRIISDSYIVITSRFHGLVSSLSQSVPCFATTWSHKYEMLLEDYDYKEGLLDLNDMKSTFEKYELLLKEDYYFQVKGKLYKQAKLEKGKSKLMWRKVFDLINGK